MGLFDGNMRIVSVSPLTLPVEPITNALDESLAIVDSPETPEIAGQEIALRVRPKFDKRLARASTEPCPELARCAESLPAAAAKGLVSVDVADHFLSSARSAVERKIATGIEPISPGALWMIGHVAFGGSLASLFLSAIHMNFMWIVPSLIAGGAAAFATYKADRASQIKRDDLSKTMVEMDLIRQVIEISITQMDEFKENRKTHT